MTIVRQKIADNRRAFQLTKELFEEIRVIADNQDRGVRGEELPEGLGFLRKYLENYTFTLKAPSGVVKDKRVVVGDNCIDSFYRMNDIDCIVKANVGDWFIEEVTGNPNLGEVTSFIMTVSDSFFQENFEIVE
jgi:hypothetical protein